MIPAFFLKNIISFVLAVLGLPYCKGYSLVAVRGLLTVEASLVVEHRLWGTGTSVVVARGLSSCGSQGLEHRLNSGGVWA